MELRQLEYFVAVARELHFARAAGQLHVAQPSISQQIKALEGELGLKLFERTSKAVVLTSGGAELLPLATELLSDVQHLRQVAQTSARRVSGRLRIGFLADEYSVPTVDRLLATIRRNHPRLVLEFHQVDFAEHHKALEDGEVDVAFVMAPAPSSIVTIPLFESRRLVAVSTSVAAAHEDSPLAWLGHEPVALPNQMASQAWRRSWTPPTDESGPTYVVGENRMEAMLAVVGTARAVCVVPEYVHRFYPQPGVSFIELAELEPCPVGIGAVRARLGEPHIAAVFKAASAASLGGARRSRRPTGSRKPRASRWPTTSSDDRG
jgi:DNA-binding transcriptional LysR family regulator